MKEGSRHRYPGVDFSTVYKLSSNEASGKNRLDGRRLMSATMKWVVATMEMPLFLSVLIGTTGDGHSKGTRWRLEREAVLRINCAFSEREEAL